MDKKLLTPERIIIAIVSILVGGGTVHFGPSNSINKLEARVLHMEDLSEERHRKYFDKIEGIERKLDRNLEKFEGKMDDIKDMIKRKR
mgnify:CR=1 FL=1